MQVQYLEIVTRDVDGICAQYSKVCGVDVSYISPVAGMVGEVLCVRQQPANKKRHSVM